MADKLPSSLYILTYHNVSWLEDYFHRGGQMVTPPDIFRQHIDYYQQVGQIVSMDVGLQAMQTNTISGPLFVITFDDGLQGMLDYAAPILRAAQAPASISLITRILQREVFFWRFELNFIANVDRLHVLRHQLRKLGYKDGNVRDWTSHHFSYAVRDCIHEVFLSSCPDYIMAEQWQEFLTLEACHALADAGDFTFLNHTSNHYYYGCLTAEDCAADFMAADAFLRDQFGSAYIQHLALPFGGAKSLTAEACERYRQQQAAGVILTNNGALNTAANYHVNYVGRIAVDNLALPKLMQRLTQAGTTPPKPPVNWMVSNASIE